MTMVLLLWYCSHWTQKESHGHCLRSFLFCRMLLSYALSSCLFSWIPHILYRLISKQRQLLSQVASSFLDDQVSTTFSLFVLLSLSFCFYFKKDFLLRVVFCWRCHFSLKEFMMMTSIAKEMTLISWHEPPSSLCGDEGNARCATSILDSNQRTNSRRDF